MNTASRCPHSPSTAAASYRSEEIPCRPANVQVPDDWRRHRRARTWTSQWRRSRLRTPTIRRDLDQLSAEGVLVRTYGGAVSLSTVSRATSNLGEAAMMREMMSRAARVAILADSSKFGRRLFAQISELGSADYLVTDSSPPPDLLDALSENDVDLITPETATSRD
jgi:DeoR/GlpR family transcriptional regulator of sugar metabolism